ncbi:MAG TPA: aminotransferase class I/II-fold pyridoxal phosphate-dependent enzyme [bacterium]|nr:aminotransferase class I/II-fold pyridoxal phosphate-dependent enzyme [bacterium]
MSALTARLSRAALNMPPSGIRKYFDLAATMKDVISLGVGEPDFITPWRTREACIYALEKGQTSYTSNYGMLELRQAVVKSLERYYGLSYDPASEVLITVGVSEALDLALRAVINPGDEVLYLEPGYVSYAPTIMLAGGVPVPVPAKKAEGFAPDFAAFAAKITPRTKAVLLNYPCNPTGSTLTQDELAELARLCVAHDLLVLSDEIYSQLSYDVPHTAIATLPGMHERTITLNGFSKAYAMTGWRLGYAAAPAEIIEVMMKIHQYTMLCAPITAQKAALEALANGHDDMRDMIDEYCMRRNFFVRRLNEIGMPCHVPQGAFYAFPSIAATDLNADRFAVQLLEEEKVVVVPGDVFGPTGAGHIRCSYATALDKLAEACVRMERFVQRHRRQ